MFEETAIKRHEMHEAGVIALDWQQLYDWTTQQVPGAILGESCTNSLDPLGNYLNTATHTQMGYWSIGPSIKNGYEDRISKPDWVKLLIEETDRATDEQRGPVTREMYLGILEQVQPARMTEIDQVRSLTMIAHALQELDVEYQTSVQTVQTWLKQRGVDLPLERVSNDLRIVRSLDQDE